MVWGIPDALAIRRQIRLRYTMSGFTVSTLVPIRFHGHACNGYRAAPFYGLPRFICDEKYHRLIDHISVGSLCALCLQCRLETLAPDRKNNSPALSCHLWKSDRKLFHKVLNLPISVGSRCALCVQCRLNRLIAYLYIYLLGTLIVILFSFSEFLCHESWSGWFVPGREPRDRPCYDFSQRTPFSIWPN